MQPLYVALFRIEETPEGNLQQGTAEECGDVTYPRAVLAYDYATEEYTRRHLAAKGEEPALCPAVRLSDPSSCSAPCIPPPPVSAMEHMALFFISAMIDERASPREFRRRRIDDVGSSVSYHLLLDGKGIGLAVVCGSTSVSAIDVIHFTEGLMGQLASLAEDAEITLTTTDAEAERPTDKKSADGRGPLARMLAVNNITASELENECERLSDLPASKLAKMFLADAMPFRSRVSAALTEAADYPSLVSGRRIPSRELEGDLVADSPQFRVSAK